ncbi:gentisate 1,2-dioxygenase [Paraburkholderia sp. RP-4-7]|jgi:gentisate 1,2-dioxygenase|uniref:Gentisate 1,2-dioxygenase n=1 Tax=Paraburkholderia polaris TaxID=2728848 RepID=A0A848IQI1_9BURK|nr:gentisate 1,2-dioxygenase [Paraburkholderia polaris]NMM04011.1 gentisate 1,2-dioxygenase [Paraburkholderia polaris]
MNTDLPTSDRKAFYEQIRELNMIPLWESLSTLVPHQPNGPCVPALWKWRDVLPYIEQAGTLITAEEAVRRVLVLENPALPGYASVTQSLYAGLQLILPGEVAPAHRHVQSALRFIVHGRGAYTAVDGERTTMMPGDFIITPSWTWHDHGNDGIDGRSEPVVWLDGLDIPMIRFFDAGFEEKSTAMSQRVTRPEGNALARYGHNLLPVDYQPSSPTSPIFSYPYDRTREVLERLYRDGDVDAWHGVKLRYVNPATGGWPMPTLATFMQYLPAGFSGKPFRSTDGAVYSVVEGTGRAVIDGQSFEFGPKDHFVVPSWKTFTLHANDDAVLFSFSDRPVQTALNILREEKLDA